MLGQEVVDEIKRLLVAGRWSMHKIARELHVGRTTVGDVAHGRRRNSAPCVRDDDGLLWSRGPLRRCPGCGGMVEMPCLLCRERKRLNGHKRISTCRPERVPRLELVDDHRVEYEQVRARKLASLEDPAMKDEISRRINTTCKLAPGVTQEQGERIRLLARWIADYAEGAGVPLPLVITIEEGKTHERLGLLAKIS